MTSIETAACRPDVAELLRIAVDVVRLAAETAQAMRAEAIRDPATKTTRTDVVTAADRAVERMVVAHLHQARPGDTVLGEEFGATADGAAAEGAVRWVLDPIDGTVNYLYGIPAYAVSVAVVVGDPTVPGAWETVAGAVVNPEVGEVFHARRGGGAWRRRWPAVGTVDDLGEPERLAASRQENLEHCLVGTGFSYDRADRVVQGEVARQMLLRARDLRRMGAAALDLCSVAAGRLDAYYESGLKPWDLAAGILVAEEAGARVSGLDGPPGEAMVVAAGAAVYPAFHALLTELHRAARTGG